MSNPTELRRYNIGTNGLSFCDPEGVWVAYEDLAASRAQPEGEAPQAVAIVGNADFERGYQAALKWCDENWDKPAATLSPLCGAQHAESGKEVRPAGYLTPAQFKRLALGQVAEILPVESGGRGKTAVYFAAQLDSGQEGSESNG